jgi:hypothetical protein
MRNQVESRAYSTYKPQPKQVGREQSVLVCSVCATTCTAFAIDNPSPSKNIPPSALCVLDGQGHW